MPFLVSSENEKFASVTVRPHPSPPAKNFETEPVPREMME
jgi:hypothetical protein